MFMVNFKVIGIAVMTKSAINFSFCLVLQYWMGNADFVDILRKATNFKALRLVWFSGSFHNFLMKKWSSTLIKSRIIALTIKKHMWFYSNHNRCIYIWWGFAACAKKRSTCRIWRQTRRSYQWRVYAVSRGRVGCGKI